MSQLDQAKAIRHELKEMFPRMVDLKDRLTVVLGEAQNGPPDGEADGSISEIQYNQLKSIEKALRNLLGTQLFDTL